jgi:hypothetical protein
VFVLFPYCCCSDGDECACVCFADFHA